MSNSSCPCPSAYCTHHGNCEECREEHKGSTFCQSSSTTKAVVGVGMKAYNKIMDFKTKIKKVRKG